MANVLITGGTGFVGTWMKRTKPDDIDAYYLTKDGYENTSWYYQPWNYIVHLAPCEPNHSIHCCDIFGGRLLYCSSGAAYNLNTDYAKAKRWYEQECLDSAINVVIARLFTFYGEGQNENKAIVEFIRRAKANEPLVISGDGNTTRSYMHGSELGKWMWAILLKGKRGEIYDVGSDMPWTMLQLAQAVIRKYNSKSKIVIEGGCDPVPVYLPRNTAKTKELLK